MQKPRHFPYPLLLATLLVLLARALWLSEDSQVADISPAAGPEETTPGGEDKSAGAEGENNKPEPKKTSNGKVLSAEPVLPKVTIGDQVIVTSKMLFEERLTTATPESLKSDEDMRNLRQRIKPITYAHNPAWGPQDAPLTILELTDLSCVPCMQTMKAVDDLMNSMPGKIRLINVHNPLSPSSGMNMAAFYGKVAQRAGTFWAYRKSLESLTNPTPEVYFQALIDSGVDRLQARRLSQTEARRFYRELDADALLVRQMNVGSPPQLYVNGIHLGTGGIALDKLKDVVDYETKRPVDNTNKE